MRLIAAFWLGVWLLPGNHWFVKTAVFSGVFRVIYINGHAHVLCRQRWSVLPPPHIFPLISFLIRSFSMNSAMATEVFAEGRHPALLLILRGKISIFPMQWCSCWVFHMWSFSSEVVPFCSHFVEGFYHERVWNCVKCALHISWDNSDWLLEVSIILGVYILLQIFNWSDSFFYTPHEGDCDSDTVWGRVKPEDGNEHLYFSCNVRGSKCPAGAPGPEECCPLLRFTWNQSSVLERRQQRWKTRNAVRNTVRPGTLLPWFSV